MLKCSQIVVLLAVVLFHARGTTAAPAATSFGYQAQIKASGVPINDTCDFEFSLWQDAASNLPGDQVGPTLLFDGAGGNPGPIDVVDGLFRVSLDFGATAFTDQARWLEVSLRCPAGIGDFATLTPRERIDGTPYAVRTRGIAVDANGQVGLGTEFPGELLEVAGNMRLAVEGFDPFIELQSDGAADATTMRIKSLDTVGLAVTASDDRPIMVVTDGGDVGIGTRSPQAKLEVEGTAATLFQVSGQAVDMVVKNTGEVGIGTTTPDAILQVTGNNNEPILLVEGSSNDTVARVRGVGRWGFEVEGQAGEALLNVQGEANRLLEVSGAGRFMGNHIALFDSTGSALADGIAIRLSNDHTNRENNFITFLNGQDIVAGRIEGFDLENGDWVAPPPLPDVNFTVDSGVSYNPGWFNPGTLPTASLSPGRLPIANFDEGSPPVPNFNPGTLPSLSFTAGTLPTATFNRGVLPTLNFDDGTAPDFDAEYCGVPGVGDVMCGFSWDAGSTPTASLTGGVRPTLTFTQGTLPTALLNPGTLPSLTFSTGTRPSLSFGMGELPSLTFDGGSLPQILSPPVLFGGASFTFDPPTAQELQALTCWAFETGMTDFLTLDPVSIAVADLKQDVMKQCKDEGVTYGSKGADYAEWLPKLDPDDNFQFAQIVGVHGGKVSLKTKGADYIMATSRAPVVVGNVPPEEEKDNYTTVGFMGQLPVVVRGKVKAGDYVIPSGLEDGTGVAVAPEHLTLEHLGRTLGRAWSDSDNEVYSLINVAIGLNNNETKIILENQQQWNEEQTKTQQQLTAENVSLKAELTTIEGKLAKLITVVESLQEQAETCAVSQTASRGLQPTQRRTNPSRGL